MQESPDFSALIFQSLQQKYSSSFHFFQVRPINELLNGSYLSPSHIQLNDIRCLVDDTEYLRRVYYYRTLTGRSEIDHRIKLCTGKAPNNAEYYEKTGLNAHHYPMMIVTNTKSLFVKRNRRLKKIQAGQGSSDETERVDEDFVHFSQNSSVNMLDELDNSSLEGEHSFQSESGSYESEQYDVFEEAEEKEEQSPLNLKSIDESSLNHLIDDYSQPLPTKEKEDFQSTAAFDKPALACIDNKHDTSISITAITSDKLQPQKKKYNLGKYMQLLQTSRGLMLSGLVSNYQNSAASQQPSKKLSEGPPNEKAEMQTRRRKIRQKAEELLRRAKNDSQQNNILRE